MQRFDIPAMTCGHCVKTITQAVQSVDAAAQVQAELATHSMVDAAAQVQADLATHSIGVTSGASVASLSAAIAAAGYANSVKA